MDGVAMKTLFTVGSLAPGSRYRHPAQAGCDQAGRHSGIRIRLHAGRVHGLNLIAASIVGGFFAVINYRIKILALQKAAPAAVSAAVAEFDDDEEEI